LRRAKKKKKKKKKLKTNIGGCVKMLGPSAAPRPLQSIAGNENDVAAELSNALRF
jgi:hypothetical protein